MAAKTDFMQIGASATPGYNFVLRTDAAGGFKLARGVLDSAGVPVTTQDILAVDLAGVATFTKAPAVAAAASPILQAQHTANQSGLTLTAYNKVLFQTIALDTASGWDVANNRYRPNVAGWYQVSWGVEVNGTAINYMAATIYKNGAAFATGQQMSGVSSSVWQMSGSRPIYFNGTTDYIEEWVYVQATGAAIGPDAIGRNTFLDALYLRP